MYSYPEIGLLNNDSLLYNKTCYFIENYEPGISLYSDNDLRITPLNWDGSLRLESDEFLSNSLEIHHKIAECLMPAGVKTIQIFYDSEMQIVDIVANHEFVSPGMLKDIVNNHFETQKIISIGTLNVESLNKISRKNFIIKPMTRFCHNQDKSKPYYARIL